MKYYKVIRGLRYIYVLGLRDAVKVFLLFGKNQYSFNAKTVQVSFRELPYPVFFRKHTSDLAIFRQVFIEKQYNIRSRIRTQSPAVIVDAGANAGFSTIFFAKEYPQARIIALEPDVENYKLLVENVRHYQNIEPVNAALWYRSTVLKVKNPQGSKCAFQMEEADGNAGSPEEKVVSITIQDLMKEKNIDKIGILKLDIEGAEKELFQLGNSDWLKNTEVLIAELHDWLKTGCSSAFFKATSDYDFSFFTKGENVVLTKQ